MILSEEQQLLKDSAKAFLSESAPISALRAMRDAGEDHMPELWTKMSEMGWPGIVIPDAYSGLEFGYVGAGVVLEEMGRTLALSPFLSSAVVAASLINQLGSEQQKEKTGLNVYQLKTEHILSQTAAALQLEKCRLVIPVIHR